MFSSTGLYLTSAYALISTSAFADLIYRKAVHLHCSDGSLAAGVWTDMPHDMRVSLEANITNALLVESSASLVPMDSSNAPHDHQFPAIHFDYYARNGTRVGSFFAVGIMINVVLTGGGCTWSRASISP